MRITNEFKILILHFCSVCRLRNLSRQDNDNTAMVIPKYQLAEHRYGREEMLALFNKTVAAPEPLRSVGGLYLEKTQLPLALIQMSEEESVGFIFCFSIFCRIRVRFLE